MAAAVRLASFSVMTLQHSRVAARDGGTGCSLACAERAGRRSRRDPHRPETKGASAVRL